MWCLITSTSAGGRIFLCLIQNSGYDKSDTFETVFGIIHNDPSRQMKFCESGGARVENRRSPGRFAHKAGLIWQLGPQIAYPKLRFSDVLN
jgi:hypothetical protein